VGGLGGGWLLLFGMSLAGKGMGHETLGMMGGGTRCREWKSRGGVDGRKEQHEESLANSGLGIGPPPAPRSWPSSAY